MAGLRVLNNDGWVQINSEHRNLRLLDKGSITVSTPLASFAGNVFSYVASSPVVSPIIAIRCSVLCTLLIDNFLGTWGAWFITEAPAIVDWWALDVGSAGVFNSGIRIWNAAGEQVYDGADRVPKVHGMAGPADGSTTTGASLLAVAQCAAAAYKAYIPPIGPVPAMTQTFSKAAKTTSANSMTIGTVVSRVEAGNTGNLIGFGSPFLLLDVAGL